MKLACNYYKETEELVKSGAIDIDYFKFPSLEFQKEELTDLDAFVEFAEKVTKIKPILFSGLYPVSHDLSSPDMIINFKGGIADKLLEITKTPGISLMLSVRTVDPDITESLYIKTIVGNILFLKERYPRLEFVSIENLDNLRFGFLLKPEVIAEIIVQSGCTLLLDISRAYYAAKYYTNESLTDYILRLPLESINEINLNGWMEKRKGYISHVLIHEQAYQTLKELLFCCDPKIVTVNYGRSTDNIGAGIPLMHPEIFNEEAKKEIAEQVNRVTHIIHMYG